MVSIIPINMTSFETNIVCHFWKELKELNNAIDII